MYLLSFFPKIINFRIDANMPNIFRMHAPFSSNNTNIESFQHVEIGDVELRKVQETISEELEYLLICTIMLLFLTNIPVIALILRRSSLTYVNVFILIDCVNALAHVFILLQFFR